MFFLATLIALPVWAGGDSSDGHNHAAPESILTAAIAPRATTASDEFEIVAALEGNQLVVYVDRFASNAPVANAKVEVEGAGLKGYASETAPGTYVMNVAAATLPARHPLAITIEAGDTTDLLSTTLDTSRPVASNEPVVGWSERVVWIIAGTLLLAAGALLAVRRRKKGI
jgi:LPXTG-motif cell wall-anchored protein